MPLIFGASDARSPLSAKTSSRKVIFQFPAVIGVCWLDSYFGRGFKSGRLWTRWIVQVHGDIYLSPKSQEIGMMEGRHRLDRARGCDPQGNYYDHGADDSGTFSYRLHYFGEEV